MPDDRVRLKDLGLAPHPHQNDHGRDCRNRCCRVHSNAQLAMVCIAFDRVDMGYLHHDQQRQQGQTHQRGCLETARLPAAACAEMSLKSSHFAIPNPKDT
jgi:hypothetical protein